MNLIQSTDGILLFRTAAFGQQHCGCWGSLGYPVESVVESTSDILQIF